MNYRIILLATLSVFLFAISAPIVPHVESAEINKITEVVVEVDREYYSGPCPATIRLKGRLTADGPLGVVRYQLVNSDGTLTASELTINSKGTFTVELTLRKNANWNDTVYLRVLPVLQTPPVPLDSNRITIKGQCQFAQAVTRSESIALGPASGRFRVTLNGFTCNRQSIDSLVNADGMDDEVFVTSKNYIVEKRPDGPGANVSAPWELRTFDIGDTSSGSFPQRIQGGSSRRFGANGGFRAGDSFPESPQKHSTTSLPQGLPLLLWEGILTRRQNAAVFIPMIWEWDGIRDPLFIPWLRVGAGNVGDVGLLIANPNSPNQDSVKRSISADITQRVFATGRAMFQGFGADHPIGMRDYDGDYRFRPEVFILTYDEALRMVQLSRSKNGEAFAFNYRDSDSLAGDYTLYLQVEMLPE